MYYVYHPGTDRDRTGWDQDMMILAEHGFEVAHDEPNPWKSSEGAEAYELKPIGTPLKSGHLVDIDGAHVPLDSYAPVNDHIATKRWYSRG